MLWATFGRLDIVAVADGKLVPQTYLKIVQPAEQGIVKEILVKEGEFVRHGQILMRMDAVLSTAEGKSLSSEYHRLFLAMRRIDAELGGKPLVRDASDPPDLFAQVYVQYQTNRRAYESALAEQKSVLEKAAQEMASAREVKYKLEQTLPHYREQEKAYDDLHKAGMVAKLQAAEKQRERIEKEHDLRSQEFNLGSALATINQAQKKSAQITADYRRQLQIERVEAMGQFEKIRQELVKQQHRHELLELKAPQDGVVKDLATHTPGTVVTPGTIMMTLVPRDEPLQAEVWLSTEDIGFVRPKQPVKLKLSAFTFQKYGMIKGSVDQVSADASENQGQAKMGEQGIVATAKSSSQLHYRILVALDDQKLVADGQSHTLTPGMQVTAEIKLGTRSVLEYLFSPVTKAFHEAGRER
jgi:HlyD family secretion protein